MTLKTAANNYVAALIIAIFLASYGALSILMHPEHLLIHQVAKLISPFLICGLGAWLAIKKSTNQ